MSIAKVKSAFMSITPQMAMLWLEKNSHNRPIAQQTVNLFARDMTMGDWTITHQGIAIADDGRIIDGQHRLWAIVESGKTVTMMVTTGLSIEVQLAVDGGRPRSTRDVIALRNRADGQIEDQEKAPRVATEQVGVARLLAGQLGNGKPSRQEQIRTYDLYFASIKRAVDLFHRRITKIQNSHILCVITRAIETGENIEDITRFVYLLIEGGPPAGETAQPRDEAVRMLRNFLLEPRKTPKRSDIYKKTERALRAYLDSEIIKTLYPASDELFVLKMEPKLTQRLSGLKMSQRRKRGAQIPYVAPNNIRKGNGKFTNQPRFIS